MINKSRVGILAGFLAADVEYAVVGGVAVNAYGYVRATSDLDIFIRPTEANAHAAYGALLQLGVSLDGRGPLDLLDDEENLRIGSAEDHVDILASIGAMSFDQVWRNRVEADVAGLRVPFISKADLIESKKQTGRLRDLVDVEELSVIPDSEATVVLPPDAKG